MSRLLTATPVAAVDPVAASVRLQSDGDDAPARLLPGSRLFVEVLEPLLEGGVRARVIDGNAELRLPFDARPGARLEVLVTGSDSRPGFVLLQGDARTDTSISPAARLIAALTQGAGEAARPPVLQSSGPLLAGTPLDVPQLIRALAHTLADSGLFYEAHQAQWVQGARDREALLNEPQAKLTLREIAAGGGRDGTMRAVADATRTAATNGRAAGGTLDGVVHRDTVTIVQQQLAALETNTVVWRGEAWRGQFMEWTVRRDDTDERSTGQQQGGSAPTRWQTRLRLALPELGAIDAALAVDRTGLDVRISAADETAVDALRNATPLLSAALGAAGLTVRRLEVRHEP